MRHAPAMAASSRVTVRAIPPAADPSIVKLMIVNHVVRLMAS
jgi:hypothetical protein